ncbi:ATP-binding cassette domain-containing protein [Streptomyces fradiae]|uniref:ATP-binding cassette domain-containing protein n=1 Tax=Streptomyces fradiae TaxID=1906 RepID=UPI0039886DB0
MDTTYAIRAEGLRKRYGDKDALDGFDLAVRTGTVHGLLGPNGAGKTTAVRVLSTLRRLDGGRAEVAGVDVARHPGRVRALIGLTGQYAAVDEILTGRQNLEMFGRLFHLGGRGARSRAAELLERFDLVEAADEGVEGYSGGMRRRLDLAASMILAPRVLFLDEPTTGLDPRGRGEVWEAVRALVEGGTTVLLTTQYLDEADQLASRITVIDRGRAIADDTPEALKDRVGGDRVEVVAADPADLPRVAGIVARVGDGEPRVDVAGRRVHAQVRDRVAALTEVARALRDEGVGVEDIGLRRPTLDDVFLRLTGTEAGGERPGTAGAGPGGGGAGGTGPGGTDPGGTPGATGSGATGSSGTGSGATGSGATGSGGTGSGAAGRAPEGAAA